MGWGWLFSIISTVFSLFIKYPKISGSVFVVVITYLGLNYAPTGEERMQMFAMLAVVWIAWIFVLWLVKKDKELKIKKEACCFILKFPKYDTRINHQLSLQYKHNIQNIKIKCSEENQEYRI
jgi:hypothetical protein